MRWCFLGTNSGYTGNWTVTSGRLEIGNNSLNALGSGSVTIANPGSFLTFNTTNDLVVNNQIDGIGGVWKLNTNTVTLSGNNTFAGSVVGEQRRSETGHQRGHFQRGDDFAVWRQCGCQRDWWFDFERCHSPEHERHRHGGWQSNGDHGHHQYLHLTSATNDILNVTGSLTLNGTPTLQVNLSGLKSSGSYRLINYSGTILGGGAFACCHPPAAASSFLWITPPPVR